MPEWYILNYKSFRYGVLKHELERKQVGYYDPYIWINKRGRRTFEPLFPSYMFLRFDINSEGWNHTRYIPGVKYLLPKNSTPISVGDDLIEEIKNRVEMYNSGKQKIREHKEGEKVIIKIEPFDELDAICQKLPAL